MSWIGEGDVPEAIRKRRAKVNKTGAQYNGMRPFIGEYAPELVEDLVNCSMSFKKHRRVGEEYKKKVTPNRCHRKPWCINCSQFDEWLRTQYWLERFHLCTPEGEKPRFIHIVVTAPTGDKKGDGWGWEAMKDYKAFRKTVWSMLAEIYGEGIGGLLTYQDFGERPFQKIHPHIDLTLNGWRLAKDKSPVKVPLLNFHQGNKETYLQIVAKHANKIQPLAEPGEFHVSRPVDGIEGYYKALRYHLREMVDLRKWKYDSPKNEVEYESYREHRRVKMASEVFIEGFKEYRQRLDLGKGDGRNGLSGKWSAGRLTEAYGHLHKSKKNKTKVAMGGVPLVHDDGCMCSVCHEWERDVEEEPYIPRGGGVGAPAPE